MPAPRLASFPAIRRALRFYQVCSLITGVMLLLLCAEMVLKYTPLRLEVFAGGSGGLVWLAPVVEGPEGLESTGDGFNLSLFILVAHGWFYVVYLFACFRVWSRMRWPFWRFLLLASGGIVPFLSFFLEAAVARDVERYLAEREAAAAEAPASGAPGEGAFAPVPGDDSAVTGDDSAVTGDPAAIAGGASALIGDGVSYDRVHTATDPAPAPESTR